MAQPATRRRAALIVLAGALLAGMLLLRVWLTPQPPTLAAAFPYGVMRIGVDASYPPFALDDGQTLSGVDIDLGRALGTQLGLEVRFETHGFDGLYDILIADRVDVVISALTINPLRMGEVRYTRHYFDNGLLLVSPQAQPITAMAALPGQRLAYEFGGAAENEARHWLRRVADFALRPYELPAYALDAVRLGEADAALADATTVRLYLRDHPDWQAATYTVTHNFYAVAVRIDRAATWQLVEDALWVLAADGTLDAILARWL